MSDSPPEAQPIPVAAPASAQTAATKPQPWKAALPWVCIGVLALAIAMLWQRLANVQEQLAQQSANSLATSAEAKALAKNASDLSRDAAAKQSLLEAKLAEVSLQRSQLEELISSLSRSRDENLLEDIDSGLRLAQQQAALTGSVDPLLAALKAAEQRIARAAQPRLAGVQRAIAKDLARLKAGSAIDVPSILTKLDEAVRAVDDLPMANGVPQRSSKASTPPARAASAAQSSLTLSERGVQSAHAWWQALKNQSADLVRLSRIDAPEASLVAPEQAYMLRENLKLKLLNARLGVLARQNDSARSDLRLAAEHISKYSDVQAKRTQTMLAALQQIQGLLLAGDLPKPEDSLAALKLAGAAR